MDSLELTLSLPPGLPVDQVADLHRVIADAAHRATDWNDRVQWTITQLHAGVVTVSLPLQERRVAR